MNDIQEKIKIFEVIREHADIIGSFSTEFIVEIIRTTSRQA